MKRIVLIHLLVFSQLFVFGQLNTLKIDSILFVKSNNLRDLAINNDCGIDSSNIDNKKLYNNALRSYQDLIDSFPKSTYNIHALLEKGLIEIELDNKTEAIKTFKRVLKKKITSEQKKKIKKNRYFIFSINNAKNSACIYLAELFLAEEKYKQALKYLNLTKKYMYFHFCGNESTSHKFHVFELYATCYIALNKNQEALTILLPNLIENEMASNYRLVKLAYSILSKYYTKEDLKSKFENAFNNYQLERKEIGENVIKKYYIIFLDTKIYINSHKLDHARSDKKEEAIKQIYLKSTFLKLLNE
jgi:tetratricopeptide (TPR) repeat protein